MTADLRSTLIARAERAGADPDPALILAAVRDHAERRARRRRNGLAAGAGVLAVTALTGGTLLLGHRGGHDGHHVAAASDAPSTAVPTGLETAGATPASAPAALGLVPTGWRYLGATPSATTYGPASADPSPDAFLGKVAVLVSTRYDQGEHFPLTLAGKPARLYHDGSEADGMTMVDVVMTDSVEIVVQVPDAAHLGTDAVTAMVDTLDVRSIAHPGVG